MKWNSFIAALPIALATSAAAELPAHAAMPARLPVQYLRDEQQALGLVDEAASTAQAMEGDRHMARLIHRARGIFFVPDPGRGNVGVFVEHEKDGAWSDPVFYRMMGMQMGAPPEQAAYIILSNSALTRFTSGRDFRLYSAGLSIVDYPASNRNFWQSNDIVFWTSPATVTASALTAAYVQWDGALTQALYQDIGVTVPQVLSGDVRPNWGVERLERALPA